MTDVEIVKVEPKELVTCEELLLTDWMLKQYCDFITDDSINSEPLIKPETNLSHITDKSQSLSVAKQLVLVRSCLADVIYSLLCLGIWCAKRTIKLYLTEFSRLHNRGDQQPGALIGSTLTILNCMYGRLEELNNQLETNNDDDDDTILRGTTDQLKNLLNYIKEVAPPPNTSWPICIVHVRRKVIAKVMALWLNEVASEFSEYSFIKPNYIVGSSRKYRNRMTVDNFDLHHEASIKDFRFGKCNTLVISTVNDRCADMLKCNLVISFDPPSRFEEFLQAKTNCRFDSSKYVIMLNSLLDEDLEQRILKYINMEKIYNSTIRRDILSQKEMELLKELELDFPPYPTGKDSKNPATIHRSIGIINKYCTKLPSDSFTKLAPEYNVEAVEIDEGKHYYCKVRLPINSPVRQAIIGPEAPTRALAIRLAAFTACKVLHNVGELDNNMCPIKKESMKAWTPWLNTREFTRSRTKGANQVQSIGSTKHRQYYKKRIARVFSGPLVSADSLCHLYKFKMVLTCEIPDEQNRRGRRIIDPNETNRNYAIVCTTNLPNICSFPVFTRSGEVMISIELVKENFTLTNEQVKNLRTFHEYTFSKVLRLEKYPTIFKPENSPFTVLLVPVIDDNLNATRIDWDFVTKIVNSDCESFEPDIEQRKKFTFDKENYVDAVVIPWYRLTDRQQFAYYVAEICDNMSPHSSFPDTNSGFKTFIDYYESKYNIVIYNKDQPILDVDHTSARLNLLTPRYVNRKGRTLPSSTAKTRKESRESLVQKQLLIPELCTIHPFPASFWRKAVCLPAIFYRLNSLFLAEELRREVAQEIKVGFVEPPSDFVWPELHFGWSLKDVIANQNNDDDVKGNLNQKLSTKPKKNTNGLRKKRDDEEIRREISPPLIKDEFVPSETLAGDDFVIDYFDPSKYDIPDIPLDAPPDEWMNIKLISTGPGQTTASGWDQPLEQRDLFLRHSNEITWDDCEMEFDGEISERPCDVRCGSPSSFEPNTKSSINDNKNNCNSFGRSTRMAVTFGKLLSDDDEFDTNDNEDGDEDYVEEESGEFESDNHAYRKQAQTFDSDSSWSLSDDEDADEDEVPQCAQWQDDKFKRQSLLRELFVPYYKPSCIKFQQLENEFSLANLDSKDDNDHENQINLIDKLKVIKLVGGSNLGLTSLLSRVFEQNPEEVVVDEQQVLNSWYRSMRELDTRVVQALTSQPDLFKDNDVELVAVDDSLGSYDLEMQPSFGELLPNRDVDLNWSNDAWKNIKFDPTREEIRSTGPGPSVILQALTMSNASDGINLERLETVGDSFLKYSITAYLYCEHLSMHEGKLSYLRSTEISNANLYRLGKSKNLGEIMSATKFEPNDNWLAPGYSVADADQVNGSNISNKKKNEIDKALAEVPYDLLRQHSIPDKSIADCVEALIGAYLTASGSRAALLFMRWLGLRVIPKDFDIENDIKRSESDANECTIWRWLQMPPSPLIYAPASVDEKAPRTIVIPDESEMKSIALQKLDSLYHDNQMDKFEQEIEYTFKDKAYLVQAFTHNSFHKNYVTDCHQRLEFLGDALLDYLITRYLFEDPRCHTPGTLTDLRSALVNNTFFASLAVKYNFHKYLKFISEELTTVIEGFASKFKYDSKDTITKGYTLLINEAESEYSEDIEVPKALGDVFESVAGAIYLDSGMSLDQVWQVYFKMMKPEIEYFSSHVPKSPIRELLESMPQNVRFSPSELTPDRKHRVTAEVFGLGRFTGVGRNKHSAKSTAAKRALRQLAKRKQDTSNDSGHQREDQECSD